jgi:hypothetical protein
MQYDYSDFDMPPTYALMSPVSKYGIQIAVVFIPNPWNPNEVRCYNWSLGPDSYWRRTEGRAMKIEDARAKWNSLKNEGYTKRNVISEPLNETTLDPWDIWSLHFTYGGSDFYELIKVYDNNYPRRNLQIS